MGNSLQEQLLRSGLATKKQSNQAKKSKKKQSRQRRAGINKADENKAHIAAEDKQKRERDQALNHEKVEQARRKAATAELDQLIADNQLEREEGEVVYRFTDGTKVKQIEISAVLHKRLSSGRVRLAHLKGAYVLLSAELAERVAARDESRLLDGGGSEEQAEDDAYAGFEVPDDLMW